MLFCVCIGIVFGIAAELAARRLRLWVYQRPQYPIINVIVVFGLLMGGIAALVPTVGGIAVFLIAFGAGLAYEILNLRQLHWWDFPDQRLVFIHGHVAIVVTLAVTWGIVPVLIASVRALRW